MLYGPLPTTPVTHQDVILPLSCGEGAGEKRKDGQVAPWGFRKCGRARGERGVNNREKISAPGHPIPL